MVERIKITPSELQIKNASNGITFTSNKKLLKSDPNGVMKAGGFARIPVWVGYSSNTIAGITNRDWATGWNSLPAGGQSSFLNNTQTTVTITIDTVAWDNEIYGDGIFYPSFFSSSGTYIANNSTDVTEIPILYNGTAGTGATAILDTTMRIFETVSYCQTVTSEDGYAMSVLLGTTPQYQKDRGGRYTITITPSTALGYGRNVQYYMNQNYTLGHTLEPYMDVTFPGAFSTSKAPSSLGLAVTV